MPQPEVPYGRLHVLPPGYGAIPDARLTVTQIVPDAFDDFKMAYPKTTAERRREWQAIRKRSAK